MMYIAVLIANGAMIGALLILADIPPTSWEWWLFSVLSPVFIVVSRACGEQTK